MAPQERKGVNGELQLFWCWEESASGHVETTRWCILRPGDHQEQVILEEAYEEINFMPGKSRKEGKVRYTISAQELADLVKKHGKRLYG